VAKIRLRCNLIFDVEDGDRAKALVRLIRENVEKLQAIRRGEPGGERSWATLELCRHDEEPPGPCEVLLRVTVA